MKKQNNLNFAYFLISLSIVLFTTSIAYSLDNKVEFSVEKKTYNINSDEQANIISVTKLTEEDIKNPKTNSNKNNSSENSNEKNDQSTSQNDTSKNNTNNKEVIPQSPTNEKISLETVNNNLKTTIQTKYGINVKYGNDTNGYTIAGLQTVSLTDLQEINTNLNNLNNSLALYPNGFFQEIKNYGFPLSVYLIKRYSQNNVTGITDSTSNNVVISIATDYSFQESMHHEIYHYMEKYIYSKGGRYRTWNELNPSNFVYGSINNSQSFSITRNPQVYFVNNYAQTDEAEDRASTFEYMTLSYKESIFNGQTPINIKARTICEQINAVFSSVNTSTTEYWERYVY